MESCQAIVHTDGWEWTVVNYANFVYAYWDSRGVVASLSLHAILGLLLVSSVFSIGGSALLSKRARAILDCRDPGQGFSELSRIRERLEIGSCVVNFQ